MFIDRHFFRSKFDYGKEWLLLTNRLSSKMEVFDIASSLANFFSDTFWVNTTVLWLVEDMWLVEDREDDFRMVYPVNGQLSDPMKGNPALFRFLAEEARPVTLDDLQEIPDLPEDGGKQIIFLKEKEVSLLVPLMLEKKIVGVLGLSKSRYGVAFDTEDLALIYTIASQAASSLLSAQLAKRIAQSKDFPPSSSMISRTSCPCSPFSSKTWRKSSATLRFRKMP
jgi:transcriptional regulator with GAF, ATPase, and Fis domain